MRCPMYHDADTGYAGLLLTRHKDELDAVSSGNNERIVQVLTHTGLPV